MLRPLAAIVLALVLAAPAARAEGEAPLRDAYGDLLPEGAVARLGTRRARLSRPGVTAVAFSPGSVGSPGTELEFAL